MKFALIRIGTTITNKKTKEKKTQPPPPGKNQNKTKNTYIVNNRDFTAYKMLLCISTVFNLKT